MMTPMIPLGIMASARVEVLAAGLESSWVDTYTIPDAGTVTRTVTGIDTGVTGPVWLAGFVQNPARSVISLESGYGPAETLTTLTAGYVQGFYVRALEASSVTITLTLSNPSTNTTNLDLFRLSAEPTALLDLMEDSTAPHELTPPARPGGITLVRANTTVANRPRTTGGFTEDYRGPTRIAGHAVALGNPITYATDRSSTLTTFTIV